MIREGGRGRREGDAVEVAAGGRKPGGTFHRMGGCCLGYIAWLIRNIFHPSQLLQAIVLMKFLHHIIKISLYPISDIFLTVGLTVEENYVLSN